MSMLSYDDLPAYLFSVDPSHQEVVKHKIGLLRMKRKDLRARDIAFIKANAKFKDISDEDSNKKLRTYLRDMEIELPHLVQLYIRCYNGLLYITELAEEKEPDTYLRLRSYLAGFDDLHFIEELFELTKQRSFGAMDKLRLLVRPYRQEMVYLIRVMLEQTDILLKGDTEDFSFSMDVV